MRNALALDLLEDVSGPAWVDFGFAALPRGTAGPDGNEPASNWFGALQYYFKLEHFKQGALKFGSAKWHALETGNDAALSGADWQTYSDAAPGITAKADAAIHAVVIAGLLVPTMKAAADPAVCPDSSVARGYAGRLKHYLDICAKDGTLDKVHQGTAVYRM